MPVPRSRLWAITAYFNPFGYARRRLNYQLFRRQLDVPLLTVEFSYRGEFELGSGDADRLVRITGSDLLWQKERLLNLAVRQLPSDCRSVAWIDSDVVFDRGDWPARALRLLAHQPLVQLFAETEDIVPGVDSARARGFGGRHTVRRSVGQQVAASPPAARPFHAAGSAPGLAWAAPRKLLERHGFYEACIVGGGDRALVCAALGQFSHFTQRLKMNPARRRHFLRWARPLHREVRGQLGHVDAKVFHLWHGPVNRRGYDERHTQLSRFAFNPFRDLSADTGGGLRWATHNAPLRDFVSGYLASRRDDG